MAILDSTNINGSLNAKKICENGKWIVDLIYPVNSIYLSTQKMTNAEVTALFGGGTWEMLPGGYCLETTTQTIDASSETVEKLPETGSVARGTYRRVSSGLPNITGRRFLAWPDASGSGTLMNDSDNIASSALYSSRISGKAFYSAGQSHSSGHSDLQIDASRCNPIYGRSAGVVQPYAYRVYAYKRTA